MKLLSLILIVPLFFACTKADQTSSLNGRWKLVEQDLNYTNGGNNQSIAATYDHFIQLNVDGSYKENVPPQEEHGQYKIQSNTIHFTSTGNNKECTFKRVDGTTLMLQYKVREGSITQRFVLEQ